MKPPERIPKMLLLTLEYPPPITGGSYRYLWNLLRFLPATAAPVVQTQVSSAPEAQQEDAAHPGIVERASFLKSDRSDGGYSILPRARQWAREAKETVARHQPDVIVAGDLFLAGTAGYILSRATGVPLIVVLYGEEISTLLKTPSVLRRWYRCLGIRMILKRARGLLCVSDYTVGLAQRLGAAPEKCLKIPPPVGDEMLAAGELGEEYRRWRDTKDLILLQTGRLVERKGQQLVIDCLPQLLREFPRLGYVIVGGGETAVALRQQAERLQVTDAVFFAGQVSEAELAAHYEDADLFVMPHYELANGDTEGCGTVFLEAALHGLAAVGGDAGGVRDAIVEGVTGLIVHAEDPGQLQTALAQLLRDPAQRQTMGEAGRQRVLTQFGAQDASEQFAQWCGRVVAQR
ncbi:MAG: glycosyltransferase family 4 protein [Armatimonadota bacterium]